MSLPAGAQQADNGDDINTPLSAAANAGQESIGDILPEPFKSWNGLRPRLGEKGLTFAATYQADPMANLSGGLRRGATYMGRLQTTLDYDPQQTLGWTGALFHVSAFQIHGAMLNPRFPGALDHSSDLEAVATTRLFEAWAEQKFAGGKLSLRLGQMAADQEFFLSPFYGAAIGGAFGWPTIMSANLPSGGPGYPFAALGARAKWAPNDQFSFMAAIFDGNPAGPGVGDPEHRNRHGVNFRLKDPPFLMAEARFGYAWGGLPGSLKLGGWRHFGKFPDQRASTDGLSLADPNSNGAAIAHRGDHGLYAVWDQQLYGTAEMAARAKELGVDIGVYAYARASISPGDRNPVRFYADGGLSFLGLWSQRPYDKLALLASYTKMSSQLRQLDFDARAFSLTQNPVRSSQLLLEATYAWRAAPGVYFQPQVQYVMRPSAGLAHPNDPTGARALHNAFMLGVRTTIQY